MTQSTHKKRMLIEFGTGTDIRGADYTKAAIRALDAAIHHNTINIAPAFGKEREDMVIEVVIGVQEPEQVDADAVAAVLPYGQRTVRVEKGGLDTDNDNGEGKTIMANAAVIVSLTLTDHDLERVSQ